MMKKIFTLPMFLMLAYQVCFGQVDQKKRWSHTIGAGIALTPSYLGDDDHQLMVFPNYTAVYSDRLTLSLFEGISYNFPIDDNWRAGPVIRYDFGRNEDGSNPLGIAGSEVKDLDGLGNVGFTIEPGAFIEYKTGHVSHNIEIRQGIGGHKGMIGEFKSEYRDMIELLGARIFYSFGPEIKVADANYNDAFFGIDEEGSLKTDYERYKAKFGVLSYGVNGSLVFPVSEGLSMVLFGGYSRLGDAGTRSDLVERAGSANQATLGVLFNHKF